MGFARLHPGSNQTTALFPLELAVPSDFNVKQVAVTKAGDLQRSHTQAVRLAGSPDDLLISASRLQFHMVFHAIEPTI